MPDSLSSSSGAAQAARAVSLSNLKECYELRTPAAVHEYLRTKPVLADVLCRLPEQSRRHFGSGSRLALEVCPDREGSGPPELYAHVVTTLPPEEAWDRLLALEEDWWLDAVGDGPVNLHVELA